MKKCLLVLAIIALMIAAGPVLAQEELDETFVAEDGSFTFNYPSAWELEVDEDGIVTVYNDEMTVFVYGPAVVEGWNWDSTDPAEILQAIADQWVEDGLEVGNIKEIEIGGRGAAHVSYVNEGTPGFTLFIVLSDGSLGALDAVGAAGAKDIPDRETVLAIAETLDIVFGGAPAVISLKDYDSSDYQDVIAELRDLNLIESGGSLLFQEDYAWFEGQGSFYTPLARNSPNTNFVMSGELTYHSSNSGNLETCTLGSRVVWTGSTTSAYVDVGYADGYGVFFINIVDGESESDGVSPLEVDISDPHTFTIISVGDAMTVFVDGELAFDQVEVRERSGTWGVGLSGQGANAKCEARDIWVYTLP